MNDVGVWCGCNAQDGDGSEAEDEFLELYGMWGWERLVESVSISASLANLVTPPIPKTTRDAPRTCPKVTCLDGMPPKDWGCSFTWLWQRRPRQGKPVIGPRVWNTHVA